jgi:quinol monooxygenase YgiN
MEKIALAALSCLLAGAVPAAQAAETVYVVTYLEVRSADVAAGAALARQYVRDSRTDAGNVAADAFEEIGRRERFLLVESWHDRPALQAHAMAAHTVEFRRRLGTIHRSPEVSLVNYGFSIDPRAVSGAPGALYVVTHVDVLKVVHQQTEALLAPLAAASRNAHGNIRYDVYEEFGEGGNHFNLFAIWSGRRDFDDYQDTSGWLKFRQQLAPLLGPTYDQRVYRRLSDR